MHFHGSSYLLDKPTNGDEFLTSANTNRISNSWRKAAVMMPETD